MILIGWGDDETDVVLNNQFGICYEIEKKLFFQPRDLRGVFLSLPAGRLSLSPAPRGHALPSFTPPPSSPPSDGPNLLAAFCAGE